MPVEIIRPGKVLDLVNIYNKVDKKWYSHQIVEDEGLVAIKMRGETVYESFEGAPEGLMIDGKPLHAFAGVTKTTTDIGKEPKEAIPL